MNKSPSPSLPHPILCHNPVLSLRAIPPWRERAAISSFFDQYEIASVAALLRNDITQRPLQGGVFV
ncbi:MAG: hypothetical protein NTZ51_11460, partial [Proteobacteria bacterium]|nr:hypothetical protein [Pseudomonadota bacterium]